MKEPLCRFCANEGLAMPATVVDHIEPHRGDWLKFKTNALQSLCELHHNSTKQKLELLGYRIDIGIDGYPLDPNHPSNIYWRSK